MTYVWEVKASGYRRFFTDEITAKRFVAGLVLVFSKQFGPGEYEVVIEKHELDAVPTWAALS